jgi:hypothetical protein
VFGIRVSVRAKDSSPKYPDRFWGPLSLLYNWYGRFFQESKSGREVKLTTHLYLVPKLRMSGVIPLLPLYALLAGTGKMELLILHVLKVVVA